MARACEIINENAFLQLFRALSFYREGYPQWVILVSLVRLVSLNVLFRLARLVNQVSLIIIVSLINLVSPFSLSILIALVNLGAYSF